MNTGQIGGQNLAVVAQVPISGFNAANQIKAPIPQSSSYGRLENLILNLQGLTAGNATDGRLQFSIVDGDNRILLSIGLAMLVANQNFVQRTLVSVDVLDVPFNNGLFLVITLTGTSPVTSPPGLIDLNAYVRSGVATGRL